jgi:hypothetical protein
MGIFCQSNKIDAVPTKPMRIDWFAILGAPLFLPFFIRGKQLTFCLLLRNTVLLLQKHSIAAKKCDKAS